MPGSSYMCFRYVFPICLLLLGDEPPCRAVPRVSPCLLLLSDHVDFLCEPSFTLNPEVPHKIGFVIVAQGLQ